MDKNFVRELQQLDNNEQVKAALLERRSELYKVIERAPFSKAALAVLEEYAEIQIALDDVGYFLFSNQDGAQ